MAAIELSPVYSVAASSSFQKSEHNLSKYNKIDESNKVRGKRLVVIQFVVIMCLVIIVSAAVSLIILVYVKPLVDNNIHKHDAEIGLVHCDSSPCPEGALCLKFPDKQVCLKASDLDVNECNSDPCSEGAMCLNTIGSFYCLQPDIDECQNNPCAQGTTCLNTVGSFYCLEADVDECMSSPCQLNSTCLNTYGSFYCLESDTDECLTNPCANGATCLNTYGSFVCLEQPQRDDIDACDSNPCPLEATCLNAVGSYHCVMGGVDVCLSNPCTDNATCINTVGSYHCLEMDLDECLTNPCSEGETCLNTPGSYHCLQPQFTSQTEKTCTHENGGCQDMCLEKDNRRICICSHPGLELAKDNATCADKDECLTDPCPEDSICVNSYGSYHCLEKQHQDVNECLEDPCDQSQTCLNTEGSYICIDHPVTTSHCSSNPCTDGATCINLPDGYHCLEDTDAGGATYTRWGKTACPSDIDTDLVYTGTAAGQHYEQEGGASNYLCMPALPEWGNYTDERDGKWKNYLYGAEYHVERGTFPFGVSSPYVYSLRDQDVPCAVCRTGRRASMILLPSRLSCPLGWTREYFGYLMSEKSGRSASEFICMDNDPETLAGGLRNMNGAAFYLVGGRCGTLRCPPFVDYRELTCAICTL